MSIPASFLQFVQLISSLCSSLSATPQQVGAQLRRSLNRGTAPPARSQQSLLQAMTPRGQIINPVRATSDRVILMLLDRFQELDRRRRRRIRALRCDDIAGEQVRRRRLRIFRTAVAISAACRARRPHSFFIVRIQS